MLEARARGPRGGRRFAVTFVILLVCVGSWALATPMYGAADEQVHMVTAHVRLHGTERAGTEDGQPVYVVPSVYTGETICYAFQPETSASCLFFDSDGPDHLARTTAQSYPPFYYLLVGWPSLLNEGLAGLYAMRFMASVWTALLLALALHNLDLVRGRRPLVLGAMACLTPAVLSFGATVNPSGMSLAAALAVWTGGLVLARSDRLLEPSHALARVGAPLCVLLLMRRDSVVWSAAICALLAIITPRARRLELARSTVAWAWAAAVVAAAAVELWMSGASTAASVVRAGGGRLDITWAELPFYIDQMGGGVLGWLDTRLPRVVYDVYTYGPAILAVLGLCVAARRVGVAIVAAAAMTIGAPLAIGALRYGYVQGRYVLPLAFGVPMLGALALTERLRARRPPASLSVAWLTILWGAQLLAFTQVLRRFTAGAGGGWWFASDTDWAPPVVPPTVLALVFAASLAGLFGWLLRLSEVDAAPAAPSVSPWAGRSGMQESSGHAHRPGSVRLRRNR